MWTAATGAYGSRITAFPYTLTDTLITVCNK